MHLKQAISPPNFGESVSIFFTVTERESSEPINKAATPGPGWPFTGSEPRSSRNKIKVLCFVSKSSPPTRDKSSAPSQTGVFNEISTDHNLRILKTFSKLSTYTSKYVSPTRHQKGFQPGTCASSMRRSCSVVRRSFAMVHRSF